MAFASHTLNSAKTNYSQADKKVLTIIFGVSKFNTFVWCNLQLDVIVNR